MTPNWERTRKQDSSLGPHQGAHVTFLFGRNGLKTYLKENHCDSLYIYTVNINNYFLLRNSLFKKIVGWPVGLESCVNTPITTTTSFNLFICASYLILKVFLPASLYCWTSGEDAVSAVQSFTWQSPLPPAGEWWSSGDSCPQWSLLFFFFFVPYYSTHSLTETATD